MNTKVLFYYLFYTLLIYIISFEISKFINNKNINKKFFSSIFSSFIYNIYSIWYIYIDSLYTHMHVICIYIYNNNQRLYNIFNIYTILLSAYFRFFSLSLLESLYNLSLFTILYTLKQF